MLAFNFFFSYVTAPLSLVFPRAVCGVDADDDDDDASIAHNKFDNDNENVH